MSDCGQTAPDLLPVILEEVREMREEVGRQLAVMRRSLDVTVEMVREFGLRLHNVERRASEAPPPSLPDNGG